MILYQINVEANYGSTGKIAEALGKLIQKNGGKAYLAHGRKQKPSKLNTYKVGHNLTYAWHLFISRLFDAHGRGSYLATKKLVKHIKKVNPDIIHLHNIHGYYINYKLLFDFLAQCNSKVIWTLHDCWAFTGHCTHFELHNCIKWQSGCHNCPAQKEYPANYGLDLSKWNFKTKKKTFRNTKVHYVPVSNWLKERAEKSFLASFPFTVVKNGIDLEKFTPKKNDSYLEGKKVILAVASVWSKAKGFEDFVQLSKHLDKDECVVMVGVTKTQKNNLPAKIIGIERTSNVDELITLYSRADCFMNLTHADSYPTTIMEAMACGTPVISYAVGGCTEMLAAAPISTTVPIYQYEVALKKFRTMMSNTSLEERLNKSRNHALEYFDFKGQLAQYTALYKQLQKN